MKEKKWSQILQRTRAMIRPSRFGMLVFIKLYRVRDYVGRGALIYARVRARLLCMKLCVGVMSTYASILVDSVRPPSAEVCRTAASFP